MTDETLPDPQTPARWLGWHATQRPAEPALVSGSEVVTWGALAREAGTAAAALAAAGIEPGVPVAVADTDPRRMARLVHALPLLGCPLMPLDPGLAPEVRQALVDRAGARWLPEVPGAEEEAEAATEDVFDRPSLGRDDVHLIVATSGSEGGPKGVMLTGANLEAAAAASAARLGLAPDNRWLLCLPPVHVGGLSILYRCLQAGATTVLMPRFDAHAAFRLLDEAAVTHVSLVPPMLARLADLGAPPASLRRVLVGGAGLSAELAETAAAWPLCPTWGMSETASQAATSAGLPEDWREGLVGPPLDGLEVRAQDDGRLALRGPMVMAGYANPDLRPGDGLDAEGWFVSGDLGRVDAQGRVHVDGRADAVLVSGGETLHPEEIEHRLRACPGVEDAAVTGDPDPAWGDVLVALVDGDVTAEEVEAWCRAHLDGARRPRRVRVVDGLPRTGTGKLDRAALRLLVSG